MQTTATHPGPRERLSDVGPRSLSDCELLALLLGTGSRSEPVSVIAARLVEVHGSRGLAGVDARELARVHGIGPTKAARVVAAVELGRRLAARPLERGKPLRESADVYASFGPRLRDADAEHFLAVPLDARNRPLGEILLAVGGLSMCPVTPGDVFRALLRAVASGVVFVHNHPSGDPTPSPEDIALTRSLSNAGALLGVRVLDHVIVGSEGFFSFMDAGLIGEAT